MLDYQKFKTAIVKGFDKDEVLTYIQKMEDEAYAKEAEYNKMLKARDAKIDELKKRISLKEEQKERLENEIEQKYKKYIDNYDRIGRLVFEAELKADTITEEAQKRADQLLAEAQEKADKVVSDAQKKADRILQDSEQFASTRVTEVEREVNEKLAEGKKKYLNVQEELNGIVELINQAQRRFMTSYKEVHRIVQNIPESLDDIDDYELDEVVDEDGDLEVWNWEDIEAGETADSAVAEESADLDDLAGAEESAGQDQAADLDDYAGVEKAVDEDDFAEAEELVDAEEYADAEDPAEAVK